MKVKTLTMALSCLCLPVTGCADGRGAATVPEAETAANNADTSEAGFLSACHQRLMQGEYVASADEATRQCAGDWKSVVAGQAVADTILKAVALGQPAGVEAAALRQALSEVSWQDDGARDGLRGTIGDLAVTAPHGRARRLSFNMSWGFEEEDNTIRPDAAGALVQRGYRLEPILCGGQGGFDQSAYKVVDGGAGSAPFLLVIEEQNPMTPSQGFDYAVQVALDGKIPSPQQLREEWDLIDESKYFDCAG